MKKKNITIDDLARMVQRGFDETARNFELTAKKKEVNQGFNKMEDKLDRIEKLILADHKRRIEKLEIAVKELKEILAVS